MHEEVAFLAIGLGWSREELLSMPHSERLRWVRQMNRINTRLNQPHPPQASTTSSSEFDN